MEGYQIDLNCDVGEGMGNEADLFPMISSCNIACGGHAGDVQSMREMVFLGLESGLHLGAHPSYPDKTHFGRRSIRMGDREFHESIQQQLQALQQIIVQNKGSLHHIKAHGALYNDLASNLTLAETYLDALEPFKDSALLYVPCGSLFSRYALERGYRIWQEAFADRAYEADGSLVSRAKAGAVLSDPAVVYNQLVQMVQEKRVRCLGGAFFPVEADTYCLHGDGPNVLEILMYLSKHLPDKSIFLRS
ncbi:5-oxoprolinase subunit PxpA [Robiginitalea sp. IMCC44478]|uniref:5-oxoprolinase subunit PxpA n=1 Tax=Robiginitalea sp. IMCC44478 TaxID=3459122 RepID=UPI004041C5BD